MACGGPTRRIEKMERALCAFGRTFTEVYHRHVPLWVSRPGDDESGGWWAGHVGGEECLNRLDPIRHTPYGGTALYRWPTKGDAMATHKVVHWELMGPDAAKLAAFYNTLFGWNAQTMPGFGDYAMVDAEESGIGGAIGRGTEEMPYYEAMYVEVDSVDEHLGLVEGHGGRVLIPRTIIPGTITFGLFTDPAGNVMGVVEAEVPPAE